MSNGHWDYKEEIDIAQWFGFVYLITDTLSNKKYIGRKYFLNYRTKTETVVLKNGTKKKKKVKHHFESNWSIYSGSSTELNAHINKIGIENFRFQIIELFKTKIDVNYGEVYHLVQNDVVASKDYYNKTIPPVRVDLFNKWMKKNGLKFK